MLAYIKCKECGSTLNKAFFKDDSETCVVCMHDAGKIQVKGVEKSTDYEVVEDKGCAGGACTL